MVRSCHFYEGNFGGKFLELLEEKDELGHNLPFCKQAGGNLHTSGFVISGWKASSSAQTRRESNIQCSTDAVFGEDGCRL